MGYLFAGAFLIFLDFTINLGESITIGLLPDFIGYIFLVRGLRELQKESKRFGMLTPFCSVMTVVSLIVWIFDLLGFNQTLPELLVKIVGIICNAAPIIIFYFIIQGIKEMEWVHQMKFNADKLDRAWLINMLFTAATLVQGILGGIALAALTLPLVIGVLASGVYFLITLYQSKEMYEKATRNVVL